jgi:hypothetical protein
MLANMIEWSFAVKSVSFEGDDIPRDAPHPLSEWLKDGEAFQVPPHPPPAAPTLARPRAPTPPRAASQVHGDLKQDVSAMHQTALGMAAGKVPPSARPRAPCALRGAGPLSARGGGRARTLRASRRSTGARCQGEGSRVCARSNSE